MRMVVRTSNGTSNSSEDSNQASHQDKAQRIQYRSRIRDRIQVPSITVIMDIKVATQEACFRGWALRLDLAAPQAANYGILNR